MKKTNLTEEEKNDFTQLLKLNKNWFSEKKGTKTLCRRVESYGIGKLCGNCNESCVIFRVNGKLCGDVAMELLESLSDTDKFEIMMSI